MAKSTYLENTLLNLVLNNTAYTPPAAVYVELYTVSPGPGGGGTPVSGNGYTRMQATFSPASNGTMVNSANVVFPQATGSGWGAISYFGIFDDPNAGNMLYYGALTAPKTIGAGDQLQFAASGITVTES